MYVQYGAYKHASGEVAIQPIGRNAFRNEAGVVYGFTERWKLSGFLQTATPALMTVAIAALEAAYSKQFQNLGLFNDDGSPTAHGILSANTRGGVQVVGPPSYPQGFGAEYSTFRSYEIILEWDRIFPGTGLIAFTESIHYSGGGPLNLHMETLNTPPQKQLVKQFTTFRAVQRGMAIGEFSYPFAPPPIWPGDLEKALPELDVTAPKRFGVNFAEYGLQWAYYFAAAYPLVGDPDVWPNL